MLDVSGWYSQRYHLISKFLVSILLMLDVSGWFIIWTVENCFYRSFNPSYAGCVWLISSLRYDSNLDFRFNPSYAGCVWLIESRFAIYSNDPLFQSFLCWMCLADLHQSRHLLLYNFRFNPSYAGCVWLIWPRLLFFFGGSRSFNPSYAGCVWLITRSKQPDESQRVSILLMLDVSGWCPPGTVRHPGHLFQSFLCWMCLADFKGVFSPGVCGLFQSFLCWMCLADLEQNAGVYRHMGFQSFLCWMCLADLFSGDRQYSRYIKQIVKERYPVVP